MNILYLGYNILDFLILRRYLRNVFGEKRTTTARVNTLLCFVCMLAIAGINSLGYSDYNFMGSCVCIYLYSCSFQSFEYKRVLPLVLYVGMRLVAEPIGLLVTEHFLDFHGSSEMNYVASAGVSLLTRLLIVNTICRFRSMNSKKMTLSISVYLSLIVIMGVFGCCVAIWLSTYLEGAIADVLSAAVVIIVLLINLLEFLILKKYRHLIKKSHQSDMMLQEAGAKEKYYREVEISNREIQKIRHDLKNRLLGIVAVDDMELLKKEIASVIEELEETEKNIFTGNVVFNTILNTKIHLAREYDIVTEVSVLMPQKINMNHGDVGILLGNLLDNAIEACLKLPTESRWMKVTIVYQNKMMIMKMVNSKSEKEPQERKEKKDRSHGFGIKSVKAIVEKYSGTIDFKDCGDFFEVDAVIYGVKGESQEDSCEHQKKSI